MVLFTTSDLTTASRLRVLIHKYRDLAERAQADVESLPPNGNVAI
jgi:hypothetical protein